MYIGSSNNIDKRIREHMTKLKNNNHENYKLQLDYNKNYHHNDVFTSSILEEVNDLSILKDRENYYIKLYESLDKGYNLNKSSLKTLFNHEELELLMNNYFKKVKTFRVPISIPYINKKGTNRQTNLKIKIFTVLMELHNILDNYYLYRINKIIVSGTLKVELKIDIFDISGIDINIRYTLKETNFKAIIYFTISEIYKTMKDKNINMEEALLKCMKDKKNIYAQ